MKRLVDTNILIEKPNILEDKELVLSIKVVKELDGLKRHQNPEIAEKARRAAVYIARNIGNLTFVMDDDNIPTDDLLLLLAKKYETGIITNDVYLKIRAMMHEIPVEGYSNKNDYSGVSYIPETEEELISKILLGESTELVDNMHENEYLIIQTKPEQYFKKIGNTLERVNYTTIKNDYVGEIKPKNPEQVCLFDALNNKNNSIVYAGGRWGTGKSYLLNNYALSQLEKGTIQKIVYIPNNSYTAHTIDLGALPGDILDKSMGTIGPLIDLIGIDRVSKMIKEFETLEIVPMSYIRGRSFTDSIIIANEAQNLTVDHMKLLLARVGEGSRIFIDGDISQTDSQLFKNKNGIQLLLKLSESPVYSKIFSTVRLLKTERSLAASAADYLEEIE